MDGPMRHDTAKVVPKASPTVRLEFGPMRLIYFPKTSGRKISDGGEAA